MNWGGDQLASGGGWPLWLDSVGTVLCTYLMGPVCGAAVGGGHFALARDHGQRAGQMIELFLRGGMDKFGHENTSLNLK